MKKNYLEKTNKKLNEELKKLKLKYEMLEMLNFYLVRKVVINEKNNNN